MILEKRVREVLIFAFDNLRVQHETISDLMTEIAALRDSLCEIGPAYAEILERHRERQKNLAKPLADEARMQFEAIIHELKTVY